MIARDDFTPDALRDEIVVLKQALRSIRDGGHDASAARKAAEALERTGEVWPW